MITLWQTIIERVLGWPMATLVLGILFRRPVTSLLTRIDGFRLKGAGVEGELSTTGEARNQLEAQGRGQQDPLASQPSPQLELPIAEELAKRIELVKNYGGSNEILIEQMQTIKSDLTLLNFQLDSPDTVEVLIRHLAATQLLQRAEFVYRLIFGSQLAALTKLNITGPQPDIEIRPYFDKAKNRSPSFFAEYSFEQWVDFMLNQKLVLLAHERYAITLFGREFLTFITEQGLPKKAH